MIIPALNEAGNIRQLVAEVRSTASVDVIVVDNNSTDSTAQEARDAGAQVIREPRRGYGYACAAGVLAAAHADVLVFLDGDYSFSPADLPLLLSPLLEGHADLVLGSRVLGCIAPGTMPPHQYFGNWLVSHLMRVLYRISITDLGPYRAIHRQLLMELDMKEMSYGWPTEMIVKAARRGRASWKCLWSIGIAASAGRRSAEPYAVSILATWFILGITFRYAWKIRDKGG